jgi:sRNA-binding regulator protein Hfq
LFTRRRRAQRGGLESGTKEDTNAGLEFQFFRRMVSCLMSIASTLPIRQAEAEANRPHFRGRKGSPAPMSFRFPAQSIEVDAQNRHAELFYLQKQIQSQTQMVIVLEDGERIEGCIEWYDRNALKVRGQVRMLVYKSAIKYMYKLGESGAQ